MWLIWKYTLSLHTECEYRVGNHGPVVKNLVRIVLFFSGLHRSIP